MKKIKNLLPGYAVVPLILLLILHAAVFYVTRLITDGAVHYDFSLPLDLDIPFVPAFIIIYLLAIPQWLFGIYYLLTHGRDACMKFLAAAFIGEIICFATFTFVPTELCGKVLRPEALGDDIFSKITRFVFSVDRPNNLFPSLHCFASWMCFRGIFYIEKEKRNKAYTLFTFFFSFFVFASTVLVKQHVFVDIIGGVALVEIGILIQKLTGAERVLEALDRRLVKRKTAKAAKAAETAEEAAPGADGNDPIEERKES